MDRGGVDRGLPKLLFPRNVYQCRVMLDKTLAHLLKKELVKLIEVFHTGNDLPLTEGESSSFLNHSWTHRHPADAVVVGECLANCGVWRGREGRGGEGRGGKGRMNSDNARQAETHDTCTYVCTYVAKPLLIVPMPACSVCEEPSSIRTYICTYVVVVLDRPHIHGCKQSDIAIRHVAFNIYVCIHIDR